MGVSNLNKYGSDIQREFNVEIASTYSQYTSSVNFLAGDYILTSRLNDLSLDIYLVSPTDTLVGYSSDSLKITASGEFNRIVILGGTVGDFITFAFTATAYEDRYTASAVTNQVKAGPVITSLSNYSFANVNDSSTVTGINFASDITATFTGIDAVARNAKSVTRNSATELIVVRPDTMPSNQSPYTLTLSNPGVDNPSKTAANTVAVTLSPNPTWSTAAGALANMVRTVPYSVTLSASSGFTITYSIVDGALPAGLSLNSSTGVISGTPTTANGSPYSFTVRATAEGILGANRAFTISQVVPDAPTNQVATVVSSGSGVAFGSASASISFTAPVQGPAPTNYTIYSNTGGYSVTGSTSPITFTQLGTYTFTIKANNAAGQSLATQATGSITLSTVPAQVSQPSVSQNGVGSNTISWSAPSNGGSAITGYILIDEGQSNAETNVGLVTSYNSSETEGSNHTYKVKAYNANGNGLASVSSANVTTQSFSFAPYGFFSFFSFSGGYTPDNSLYFDTKVLTPDGVKPASSLQVGDKVLGLDFDNTVDFNSVNGKIRWSDWFSDSETIKEHNIVETTITEVIVKPQTEYTSIDGTLFTESHRILVKKNNVVSFIAASDVDNSYQVYSPTVEDFVDIYVVEDIALVEEASAYTIKCEPYNNFFTEQMLVFDSWKP